MDRDHKIEKINAYRKLLDSRKLPKVDQEDPDPVCVEIYQEFKEWAENQISILLGEKGPISETFTGEEISILKTMVEKIQSKAAPLPAKTEIFPVDKALPEIKKRPPVPQNRFTKEQTSVISRLEKMDLESPEY